MGAVMAIAAIGLRRAWLSRLTAVMLAFAAVGSLAAIWSGEEDEDAAEHAGAATEQVFEQHEEWGERTRNATIVAALVAGFAAFSLQRLPGIARGAAALTAALALAASWSVIQAGHYGGLLVYQHGVGVKSPVEAKGAQAKKHHHDDD